MHTLEVDICILKTCLEVILRRPTIIILLSKVKYNYWPNVNNEDEDQPCMWIIKLKNIYFFICVIINENQSGTGNTIMAEPE